MNLQLINTDYPLKQSSEDVYHALKDLDILKLSENFLDFSDEKDAVSWFCMYISTDRYEIGERSTVFQDLISVKDISSKIKNILNSLSSLQEFVKKSKTSGSRLYTMTFRVKAYNEYVKCIGLLKSLLNEATFSSNRLTGLKRYIDHVCRSEDYATIVRTMDSVNKWFSPPKDIFVGINSTEYADAYELGIICVNGRRNPEVVSLIPPGSKPANSLFNRVPFKRSSQIVHFEAFLLRKIERRWLSRLIRLKNELGAVNESAIGDLLSLTDGLKFYLYGIMFINALKQKGCSLRRPMFSEGNLEIVGMEYPHLALLHDKKPFKNNVFLKKANAAIITGANHSGKTSYLKTISQLHVLAQLGFLVPAQKMNFTPKEKIFTLFSSGEDAEMKYSRMGIEVKEIKRIVSQADSNSLVLINEPLTSTNPREAVGICADLVKFLLRRNADTLLVTHMYDIYFLLKEEKTPGIISLVTQSGMDEENNLSVSYKVYEAEPESISYAENIAEEFGVTTKNLLLDKNNVDKVEALLRGWGS